VAEAVLELGDLDDRHSHNIAAQHSYDKAWLARASLTGGRSRLLADHDADFGR
jgi:hypothetical protein